MPMTKCGTCGGAAFISDANKETGAEAYCSESCAKGPSAADRLEAREWAEAVFDKLAEPAATGYLAGMFAERSKRERTL